MAGMAAGVVGPAMRKLLGGPDVAADPNLQDMQSQAAPEQRRARDPGATTAPAQTQTVAQILGAGMAAGKSADVIIAEIEKATGEPMPQEKQNWLRAQMHPKNPKRAR
jgi:hypothetical protein